MSKFRFFSLDILKINFVNVCIYIFIPYFPKNCLNGQFDFQSSFLSKKNVHLFTQSPTVGLSTAKIRKSDDSSILTSLLLKFVFVAPTQEAVGGGGLLCI